MLQQVKAKPLTAGLIAQKAGINLETVRYYERRGLLPQPPRSAAGYRMFPPEAARRLRFIKRAQDLGFSLQEIRELLALRTSSRTSTEEVRKRAQAKIADITRKIKTLSSMKKTLQKLVQSCSGCAPISKCPILESLEGEDLENL